MRLLDCRVHQKVQVIDISGERAIRKRLIDMGITTGTVIFIRKMAPMGDPMEINLRGYELSLRKEEAEKIEVEPLK